MENKKRKFDGNRFRSSHKQRYFHPPKGGSFRHEEMYNKYGAIQDRPRLSRNARKKYKRAPSRPQSPIVGSEEYMSQKIQKTSAIIMRHLLSPEENTITLTNNSIEPNNSKDTTCSKKIASKNKRKEPKNTAGNEYSNKKAETSFNVEEIHAKIMNHLSNLNDGRKKNFISTSTSAYDETIQRIIKQKRLEISLALRNVCNKSSDVVESTEWINSIIPDMGMKIEDLPQEVLEALQTTFSDPENFDSMCSTDLTGEVMVKSEQENFDVVEVVEILPTDIVQAYPNDSLEQNYIFEDSQSQTNTTINETINDVNIPNSKSVQTLDTQTSFDSKSTQTKKLTIDVFLKRKFKNPPKTLSVAVKRMLQIDEYIAKLTQYRQTLFQNLKMPKVKQKVKQDEPRKSNESNEGRDVPDTQRNEIDQNILNFGNITEKTLVLQICDKKLVAGTESGKVYIYCLKNGSCINVLEVTTVPISCLYYTKGEQGKPYLFIGSFGSSLKVYNFYSTCLLQDIQFGDSVQCMDENWGYLFLGCMKGTILRYSIKKNILEHEEQHDGNPIFVLKATLEGARMVLLIGSRYSSIIIRDAMSGLHLRTMENIISPTVYSIIMDKNLVYCGTTAHDILAFDFHNGKLMHSYKASNAKGITCMKIIRRCLFASCYNGKVYAYNLETNHHIDTLDGPGGAIISMEVLNNQIIVGTMSRHFSSIPMPPSILTHL